MYYEEKIIKGVLHCKVNAKGNWIPFTKEGLTDRLTKYQNALKEIRDFNDDSEHDDPGQIAHEALKDEFMFVIEK